MLTLWGVGIDADQIDAKTQEIKPSSEDTYSDMLELADELPDSSPRFILLSYPLTLVHEFSPSILFFSPSTYLSPPVVFTSVPNPPQSLTPSLSHPAVSASPTSCCTTSP